MNETEDMELEDELDGQDGPDSGDGLEDGGDELFGDDEESSESTGDQQNEEEEDDESESSRPRARKVDEDEDDDEEEEDVEADLDEILRGRMATDDDDDEDDAAPANDGAKPGVVNARKSDEFVCGICFMVVAQQQTGLPCPMGDGLESHQPLDM